MIETLRESDWTHYAGQAVESGRTYRDKVFKGHVDSVQAGTGADSACYHTENATAIRHVVQRVPVKIVFDEPTGSKAHACARHVGRSGGGDSMSAGSVSPHCGAQFNPWLIAASVCFAHLMEVLDTSVAKVALPHIAGSLPLQQRVTGY